MPGWRDHFAATLARKSEAPSPPSSETVQHWPVEWEIVPDTQAVWSSGEGWGHESILQAQLDKWPDFLRSVEGPRALGQSHEAAAGAEADYRTHNTIMSFGYALSRAAEGRQTLSVLDWGGGLGHYYVYARALCPALNLDYTVKDLPGFCEAGRKLLPSIDFEADDVKSLSRSYNFVFASGSLQYTRDYYGLLARLCDSAADWLMVTRVPTIENGDDLIVVQRPHMYGYMTEYAGWIVNRRRLLDFVLARGFSLEREFLVAEELSVPNATERSYCAGFLFGRTSSSRSS
jgi:putative methyltransferase (TIGR04325 family)